MRSICIITRPDPGASATSVRSCLYPLLLIIPQTPHNKTKLGATVLQWARRCSLCRGAQLPYFCLFPTLLEQLSTAKGLKTWARFPCTSLLLTGSSYRSSPVLSGYLFCRCSPVHMSWLWTTHISQSDPFILPVLQTQHLQHTVKKVQVKGNSAVF